MPREFKGEGGREGGGGQRREREHIPMREGIYLRGSSKVFILEETAAFGMSLKEQVMF